MLNASLYHRQWRISNPEQFKRNQTTRFIRRKRLIDRFRDRPCYDCHGSFDLWQMEFDHTRGDKKFNITTGLTTPLKVLLEEIAKCDVVCANCHKTRTYKRNQQRRRINEGERGY